MLAQAQDFNQCALIAALDRLCTSVTEQLDCVEREIVSAVNEVGELVEKRTR